MQWTLKAMSISFIISDFFASVAPGVAQGALIGDPEGNKLRPYYRKRNLAEGLSNPFTIGFFKGAFPSAEAPSIPEFGGDALR